MKNRKINTFIAGGDVNNCLGLGYIMVSDGSEEFAVRAVTRYLPESPVNRAGVFINPITEDFPVIDIGDIGCRFSHAYCTIRGDEPLSSYWAEISIGEMAKFLHGQRKALAELVGPVKFAEIDSCICRAIRRFAR